MVVVVVVSVMEMEAGDVDEVVAGLCLRRTSVTLKIAPLASMGEVVMEGVLLWGSVVTWGWSASISSVLSRSS